MSIKPRFNHQEKSFQKGIVSNILFDTSDPGTGKTRVQLDIHQYHRHHNQGKCALVLAPKTLLYPAWVEDAKQFTPDLKLSVATAPNREKSFSPGADMYITNSDAAAWLASRPAAFFEPFDTLIMDEITSFKNPTTKRSKAMAEIVKFFPRRYGLTGTPTPNHITDIWHPTFLLDDGARLGKNFFAFRSTVCYPVALNIWSQPGLKRWVAYDGVEFQLANLIADINIRHRFEDCIDIPETHFTYIHYDLTPKSLKQYKALKQTAILALQEGFILGVNKATLMNKLFQACSGSIYTTAGEIAFIDNQRTEILIDLIHNRDHCVVYYQWDHQRDSILKALKKAKISVCLLKGTPEQRGEIVKEFQAGKYRVFLSHPQTSAYGLTLTRATAWIWASLTWNLEHFLHGNRRVARAGQEKRTEQIIITANNSVENNVLERLKDKNTTQETILSVLEEL